LPCQNRFDDGLRQHDAFFGRCCRIKIHASLLPGSATGVSTKCEWGHGSRHDPLKSHPTSTSIHLPSPVISAVGTKTYIAPRYAGVNEPQAITNQPQKSPRRSEGRVKTCSRVLCFS
jgi:hypothetical protein